LVIISEKFKIKRSILDNANSEELKQFLKDPHIDMSHIEDRPVAFTYMNNILQYYYGKDAIEIKKYLDYQDPQKEMIIKATSNNLIRGIPVFPGKANGAVC